MFIDFILAMLVLPLVISSNEGYSNQTEPSELKYFEMCEENKTAIFEWSDTKREMVPLQQEDDECIYRGSLREDPSSRVLVTGCEWEDRSIQIHSVLYGDTLATSVNGSVELLQEHGNFLMNDMVENNEFLQQLHQEQLGKRIKREYVTNHDFRKQFPISNNANRNLIMPKLLDLPINIYLSPSWISKFGGISGGKSKAKEILSHVKLWFLHRSLDTKINIIYVDSNIVDTPTDLDPTGPNLKSLENDVSTPPSGHAAIVYLTAITGGPILGIAYVTAICDSNKKKPRSMSRWHDSDLHTAQTVAHEIGHNLGYFHDFDTTTDTGRNKPCGPGQWNNGPDNDLMNYASNSELKESKWSDCTNEDFRNYFAEVTSKSGSTFCLEEQKITCSSFTHNTLLSGCPDPTTLDNGRFFCLEDDMTCHVVCDPGYYLEITDMAGHSVLKAQRFMKCLGNTWTPLPTTFQCTLDCDYSGNAQNPACAVDGGWSGWSAYTPCSLTCGSGTRSRERTCTEPIPANGGSDCFGNNKKIKDCFLPECPVSTCRGGATTLSTSPGQDMVLCKDKTRSTCERDFESLCPAGWNLCTPGQFNNRNDGWDYNWKDDNAGRPLGAIYCKGGTGAAAHYTIYNSVLNTDERLNCGWSSSRPGCEYFAGWADCDRKHYSALCCAPTRTCGDGLVQQEEDCDDGNNSNNDDCLNSCTWKTPREHGISGKGC